MDRNALIGALLNGDRTAIGVLADLIEEEGDFALAERTRARKLQGRKLLRLSLELVHMHDALRFACDFFEHALRHVSADANFVKCLAYVRAWTQPEATELEPTRAEAADAASRVEILAISSEPLLNVAYLLGREAAGRHTESMSIETSVEEFLAIIGIATEFVKAESHGDHAKRRRKNNQLRQEIYRLAMQLLFVAAKLSPYRSENAWTEMEWQLEHMRRKLNATDG